MENGCGIYKIESRRDGMIYIGSASVMSNRWKKHRGPLNKGKHKNKHLQSSWDKYGEENFRFVPLFECKEYERCGEFGYESILIKLLWDTGILYNKNPVAELMMQPKPVKKYDIKTKEFLERYNSMLAASHETGIHDGRISEACSGIAISAGGFYWSYDGGPLSVRPIKKRKTIGVSCYDEDLKFVKKFYTDREAEEETGISRGKIQRACRAGNTGAIDGYYFAPGDNEPKIIEKIIRGRKVKMYKDEKFVRTFESMGSAADETGISNTAIWGACNSDGRHMAGDYHWTYDGEDLKIRIPKSCETGMAKWPCCYRENGELVKMYKTTKEASGEHGANPSVISAACRGEKRTVDGLYWAYRGGSPVIRPIKNLVPDMPRKVNRYSLDDVYIDSFDSIGDAKRISGAGHITEVCRGKAKTSGGYVWKYA